MRRVYRATIGSLLRGKLFWICLICSLVFIADYAYTQNWDNVIQYQYGDRNLHKLIYNFAVMPGANAMFLFISIIASVDIMRDKRNGFYDVVRATQLTAGKYLFAKCGAYLTLGFAAWSISTAGYWAIYAFQTAGKLAVYYYDDVWEVVWMSLQRVAAMAVPALTLYLSIAVFAAVFTGKSLYGILAGLLFGNLRLIPHLIHNPEEVYNQFTPFGQYFYPIANANADFWYFRHIKRAEEELASLRNHPHAGRDFAITLAVTFGVSAVLLIISRLRMRKQKD